MLSAQNAWSAAVAALSLIAAGCGSSSSQSAASPTSSSSASGGAAASPSPTSSGSPAAPPGALSAEARSAATGDIPDNQVFLVLTNQAAGYAIKYPEGWTRQGAGDNVTFHNNNNLVRVVIRRGPAPTPASVAAQLTALKRANPTLAFRAPKLVPAGSSEAVKATYTTQSAPNPVTGKRVTLIVDRYELTHGGRVAVVDLGTPVGVDNVDAYRKMIESFVWR